MVPRAFSLMLLAGLLTIFVDIVPVMSESDTDVIVPGSFEGEEAQVSNACTLTYYPSSSSYYGSGGGSPWSDAEQNIPLCTQYPTHFFGYGTSNSIGQLSTTYNPGALTYQHGSTTTGTYFNCQLSATGNELIIEIIVWTNTKQICGFYLFTNQSNSCTIGGSSGCQTVYQSNWVPGQFLSWLQGRSGSIIDALMFVTAQN